MTTRGAAARTQRARAAAIQAEGHLRSPTGAEPPNPASKAASVQAEGHLRGASARAGSTQACFYLVVSGRSLQGRCRGTGWAWIGYRASSRSVCPKSSPTNSSGSPVTFAAA